MPVRPWCDFVAEDCGVELKIVWVGNFEFDGIGALLVRCQHGSSSYNILIARTNPYKK